MIKRLVKMQFKPEEAGHFIELFDRQKDLIRAFPGCLYLELLRSRQDPSIFFTFRFWTGEDALNHYRDSELFRQTWAETKKLFSQRPEAWTTESQFLLNSDENHPE